jgi:HEAT repeat protein
VIRRRSTVYLFLCAVNLTVCHSGLAVAQAAESDGELVQMVVELLADKDNDVRALGFDQVRTSAPGEHATVEFASQLRKLSPDGQIGLLSALADRGDAAARDEVLSLLNSTTDEGVKTAAIAAISALANPADVQLLIKLLETGAPREQAAARAGLATCSCDETVKSMRAELTRSPVPLRVALIEILTMRRALEALPDLLQAAGDDEGVVRAAAMSGLGQLAGAKEIPGMVQGVLKAPTGPERQAAERALLTVCNRVKSENEHAEPLLDAMETLSDADRQSMLPTLGRTGGVGALKSIESSIADQNPAVHDLGIRALCNWPNATIAPRLIDMAKSEEHDAHRSLALRTLIRVAPLADGRSDEQKLALLLQAKDMCTRDEERQLILQRAAAIRSLESLRFIVPYLEEPAFAQQAAESVVELAHHRGLREPNKVEFDVALDRVMEISDDPTVRDRATRYKNGQTWNRPRPSVAR